MRHLSPLAIAARLAVALVLLPCVTLANPGTLDTSFGYGGTSATRVRAGFDHFRAAAVRPDGRVVAVGSFCTGPYESTVYLYFCPKSAVVMQWTAAGVPDASFGAGGRVVLPGLAEANSVALQPDGKVVVGGVDTSFFTKLALYRLTTAGQPDATFGTGGLATSAVQGIPRALAVQADGRIVVGGSYQRVDSLTRFLAMRFTASGAVDTTFGGDGVGDDTLGGMATAVAIQADGRIALAGRYNSGYAYSAAVARLTASGALDTSFAGSGVRTLGNLGGGVSEYDSVLPQGIVQQADGKLVVAGSSAGKFLAFRLATDGATDTSFGASGYYFRTPSAATLVSTPHLAMLPDGRLLLAAATAPTGEPGRLTLVQVTANGFDDAAFGIAGQSIVPAGPPRNFGTPLAVRIHADGKPQVAGFEPGALLPDVLEFDVDLMATARFSAAGILDATFGTSGQVFAQPVANDARIRALARSGSILLGFGAVDDGARSRLAIARFDGGGRLLESNDTTARGGVTVGETGDASAALAATQAASGDFVGFAGWESSGSSTRFLAGVVDALYGFTANWTTHAVGASVDVATAVAWQSGQLVVAGNTFNGTHNDAAVIRVTVPALALDTTFGASGKSVFSFGSGDSDVAGAAVQADGKIVVAGSAFNGSNYDFALARLNANGTLDTSFGSGGKVVTPIGAGNDFGRAVAIQADGAIVVAGTVYSTINESNIGVARYTAAGALDATFNGTGFRSIPFAAGVDDARALAIKPDGRIVVSGSGRNGATKDVIVAQLTSAGALDATFNATGKVTTSFSAGDDEANAVLIQANEAIVVGGSLKMGESQGMLLARYAGGDPPYVSAVNRISQSPASTTPVLFEVLFSEPVTGVDASDFALTVTGTVTGAAITGVSGSGNERIVTVSRTGGTGTIRLDVLDDDSIVDGGGTPLNGPGTGTTYVAGQAYAVNPPVTITTTSLPAVSQGAPYSQALAVSGGAAPYAFTVLSGSPPPGIELQADGSLVGAATQAGTFNFTVQVQDAGGSGDTQALSITVNPLLRNLGIGKSGQGTVVSVPAGIDCGSTCSAQFPIGTSISLGAVAATGYVFTGWSGGGCSGTGTCVVALNASTVVTATFTPVDFTLSVGVSPGGKVLSAPAGIDCPGVCSTPFPNGQVVTLTASATDPRLVFTNWSGACTGSGACQVTMSQARSVTAIFAYTINVNVYNNGGGTIVSTPPGISCGPEESECEGLFIPGTPVTLTATALPGGRVSSLTGSSCTGQASCQVSFAAADQDQSANMQVGEAIFLTPLTVTKAGSGAGTVATAPASALDCGATCGVAGAIGSQVTLVATAAPGSTFIGWSGGGCSGTGTCVVTFTAAATSVTATFNSDTATGTLSAAPASPDFGGQSMGTTSPAVAVTLTNTGGASLTVTSVSTSTYFAVSHDCSTLVAGASCTASVTFTPTAQGSLNGTLTVQSSAGTLLVPLAGTGERSLVTHYYRSILRRAPDAGGKGFWESEAARMTSLGANVNETWYAMAVFFFASAEYLGLNRDDAGFVTDLYNTFFNRPPDGGGISYWTGQIAQGMPREVVLVSFMLSPEFVGFTEGIFGNTAARKEVDTVMDFYRGLLSRLPDPDGFNYWVGQFRTAQCQGAGAVYAQAESISSSFLNGAEYAARNRTNSQFVGDLYNAFLRRGGDLGGVQFWIDQLATGARTRDQVRQQFIASAEFNARVNAIIAQGCLP